MIFLDVGAHQGHTLEEVTTPNYTWDAIHAFEPMPREYTQLSSTYSHLPFVHLHQYGLDETTTQRPVYGTNDQLEASIYPDKNDVDPTISTLCDMIEASLFFEGLDTPDDAIIMKLNCEGAEIPIMNNLLGSGQYTKLHHVMIDFDCVKIPSMADQEAALIARMNDVGFTRWAKCQDVMHGATHQDRIAHWLTTCLPG